MISIIICSVNLNALHNILQNIENTIGAPYEVIAVDNSAAREGICKVYNNAAKAANFGILLFLHEDVQFDTIAWGKLVAEHLCDPSTGLIGLAGGDAKSLVPSSWSVPVVSNEINIYQHYKLEAKPAEHITVSRQLKPTGKSPVVAVDGVFLCTKKEVFNRFQFDEELLTGFHGYDIDYSLQVGTIYKIYVVFDIVMHHFSEGTPNEKWIETAQMISGKWKNRLPVSIDKLSNSAVRQHHWQALQVYLKKLIQLDYSFFIVIKNFLFFSFNRFFKLKRFLSMGKFLALEYLHQKK